VLKVKDLLRGSATFKKVEKLFQALELLKKSKNFQILEIKNGFLTENYLKDNTVYADVKIIMQTTSLKKFQELVEFQLIMHENMLAKKAEHRSYDFLRIDLNDEFEETRAKNESLYEDMAKIKTEHNPKAAANLLGSQFGTSPILRSDLQPY